MLQIVGLIVLASVVSSAELTQKDIDNLPTTTGLSEGQRKRVWLENLRAEERTYLATQTMRIGTPETKAAFRAEEREKQRIREAYGLTEELVTLVIVEAWQKEWPDPEGKALDKAIAELPGPTRKKQPKQPEPKPRQRDAEDTHIWRRWTDSTGKHKVLAIFRGVASGKVTLEKSDGSKVTLPLERLSEADQKWVRGLMR